MSKGSERREGGREGTRPPEAGKEARMEHVTVRWAMGSNIAFKNKSAKPHKHNSAVGQVEVRVRGLVLRNSDKFKGEWYREREREARNGP